MLKYTGYFLCLFIVSLLKAQTYEELSLLYARPSISGTARAIGSGGAYGSVGADLGSVTINPAGIGLYRSTDFSVTPALLIAMNETKFNGSVTNTTLPRVSINQAGVAFTKVLKSSAKKNDFSFNPTRLHSFTIAINYQRQAMFSRTQNFDGLNTNNSGVDYYTFVLNETRQPLNTDNYPIEMVLAYSSEMIYFDSATNSYISRVAPTIYQSGSIQTKGAVDELDFAFGGNVSDKFYFGVGLGVNFLNYQRIASFTETDSENNSPGFQDYTFSTSLRESGVGFNARFGAIYRPASWMRFGLAYHIPTYYALSESYAVNMTAYFDTFYYAIDAASLPLKYKLRNPMKGVASASFYLKENGFFSIDYEFLNYGSLYYNFGGDYKSVSQEVNASAKATYTFGHVIRAGFEGAYKTFRGRLGYSIATSPYKKDKSIKGYDELRHQASLGLGYRGNRFYIDGAYLIGIMKDASYPYADFELKNAQFSHQVFITVGWKINRDLARASKPQSAPSEF
jgi:hypothetical protein